MIWRMPSWSVCSCSHVERVETTGTQQLTQSLWARDSKSMRHSPTLNTTLYNFTAPFVFKKQNKTLHWELEIYKSYSPTFPVSWSNGMSRYTHNNHSSYTLFVTVLRTNLSHNSVRVKVFCYHTITLKAPMPFFAIQSSDPCHQHLPSFPQWYLFSSSMHRR